MIKVRGLSKSYDGNLIFENVNFDITKGSTTVIIGGSGCGKRSIIDPGRNTGWKAFCRTSGVQRSTPCTLNKLKD